MSNVWQQLKSNIKQKGPFFALTYISNLFIKRTILDGLVIKNAKNKLDSGTLVDFPSHSIEESKKIWNNYDWSLKGEEWNSKKATGLEPEKWKKNRVDELILKHVKKDPIILEIGSGAGRWTEYLQKIAKNLFVTDISQRCLDLCKDRFKSKNNLEFKLINNRLDFLDVNSIDFIWSYDVFVHVNPSDIEKYIEDFFRILKPGGIAVIHHSGKYSEYKNINKSWRTSMGANQFSELVNKYKMKIVSQDKKLTAMRGDVISIFMKPSTI